MRFANVMLHKLYYWWTQKRLFPSTSTSYTNLLVYYNKIKIPPLDITWRTQLLVFLKINNLKEIYSLYETK
jgi:hypothetical protein